MTQLKNPGTKRRKSPKHDIHAYQNMFEKKRTKCLRKSAKFTHADTKTNLDRGANDENPKNLKNRNFLKQKKLINQIHDFFDS